MANKKGGLAAMYQCCTSTVGWVHLMTGVGVGFLLVSYFSVGRPMLLGWLLVGAGVVLHLMGKVK